MTKQEFMSELDKRLQDVSYEERQSALRYYEEYFEEAGEDENVVNKLETPEEIAGAIKEDLDIRMQAVRSSLNGDDTSMHHQSADRSESQTKNESGTWSDYKMEVKKPTSYDNHTEDMHKMDKKKKETLIIIGVCVFSFLFLSKGFHPFFGSSFFFGGGFSIIGWIFSIIGLIIGLTVAGYGLVLSGIALFVVSIFTFFTSTLHGMFFMGASFLLIGIGFLLISGTSWFWSSVVPKAMGAISDLIHGRKDRGRSENV